MRYCVSSDLLDLMNQVLAAQEEGQRGDTGVQGGEALRNNLCCVSHTSPAPDLGCSPALHLSLPCRW